MKVRIGGAWISPTTAKAFVSGAWRTLIRGKAYVSGAWRDCATFVLPMTASITATNDDSSGPTAGPFTCTPSGGLGPYTYAWTVTGSTYSVSLSAPTSASTYAVQSVHNFGSANLRCVVTDSLGSTATATTFAYFYDGYSSL